MYFLYTYKIYWCQASPISKFTYKVVVKIDPKTMVMYEHVKEVNQNQLHKGMIV